MAIFIGSLNITSMQYPAWQTQHFNIPEVATVHFPGGSINSVTLQSCNLWGAYITSAARVLMDIAYCIICRWTTTNDAAKINSYAGAHSISTNHFFLICVETPNRVARYFTTYSSWQWITYTRKGTWSYNHKMHGRDGISLHTMLFRFMHT